jgi:hypothetical protein
MNPESIKSLREFNKKQVESNIKLHKVFLSMIIVVNIILVIFIIIYKLKISSIKSKSDINSLTLKEKTDYITSVYGSIMHKLTNIFAISANTYGNFHFSMIFENSDEVNFVKEILSINEVKEESSLLLIYQEKADSDDSQILLDIINYFSKTLILIETKSGEKFGFFFEDEIYPNRDGYFESDSNRCFIFSIRSKEKYNCAPKNVMFEVNKDSLFSIGNGDIEIDHDFMTYGGHIKFPFESFDITETKDSIFNKLNGYFEIQEMEIYIIYDDF